MTQISAMKLTKTIRRILLKKKEKKNHAYALIFLSIALLALLFGPKPSNAAKYVCRDISIRGCLRVCVEVQVRNYS